MSTPTVPAVGSLWRNKRFREQTIRVTEATEGYVKAEGISTACLPLMSLEHCARVYESVPVEERRG